MHLQTYDTLLKNGSSLPGLGKASVSVISFGLL